MNVKTSKAVQEPADAVLDNDWLERYTRLNSSFSKSLVFRIGVDSGFFAEYNNMVLAMAYCLKHKIRFVLSSKHALFSYKNGWADFFEPFVQEDNEAYNRHCNSRTYKLTQDFKKLYEIKPWILKERVLRMSYSWLAKYYKKKHGITYFTQDLWPLHRAKSFEEEVFNIPELGLHNAPLLEVTRQIISAIWRYSADCKPEIAAYRDTVNLPDRYISMQIRSGDKFLETRLRPFDEYMDAAKPFVVEKNAFILTDDYTNIELLRQHYPDWNFLTLCNPDERGYFHADFKVQNREYRYQQHLKLFASIDICAASDKFIGTYSANPGMYMGMRCGEHHCYCIDSSHWQMA